MAVASFGERVVLPNKKITILPCGFEYFYAHFEQPLAREVSNIVEYLT
ncbi:MAG: hypothetical protein WB782_07545 [Thermoplasmata archaeon]